MIFERCKVDVFFAWAGRDPGIKSLVLFCVEFHSPLAIIIFNGIFL